MNDVVDFQSYKKNQEFKEQEHFDSLTSEDGYVHDDDITTLAVGAVDFILDTLLKEEDIDIRSEPAAVKEVLLCVESIRGMVHRVNGTKSRIHELTDDIFTDQDCEEIMKLFF